MKKRNLLVTALMATCLMSFSANAETLKLGTEGAYAPFNSIDKNGKLVGFDIEIGDALCAVMEVKCEWVTSDWDGIIPALVAKKFDAIIASMSITDERKQKIDFTGKYYTSPVKFARNKGSSIEISAAGLSGKVVAVQAGTVTDNFVTGTFPDAEVRGYKTQDEANLDFLAGRVDVVAADAFVLYEFLATKEAAGVEATGPDFDDKKYLGEGIGIGVRKEDVALRDKLTAAIATIRADGTYKKINDKYFKFDVYGQ